MQYKYYTPELEEFHVGFEYESLSGFTDGTVKTQEDYNFAKWNTVKFKCGELPYIDRVLNGKNAQNGLCGIRVKHLDKDDIEELGWNQETYDTFSTKNGNFALEFDPEYNTFIYRRNAFSDTVFKGKIKNKSELRKLMKQANIK